MWENAEFRNVTLGCEKLSALKEIPYTFCEQCIVLSSFPLRFQDGVFSGYMKICDDGWL